MFQQLCGEDNLSAVILATTHWTNSKGQPIPESEGAAKVEELINTRNFWGDMIAKGSRVERHDGTRQSAERIVSRLVDSKISAVLSIQKQMVDHNIRLDETNAGIAVNEELHEEKKRNAKRIFDLNEEREQAIKENDRQWQQQVEEDRAIWEAKQKANEEQTKGLRTNLEQMAAEYQAKLVEMQQNMDSERLRHQEDVKKHQEEIQALQEEQKHNAAKYREELGDRQKTQAELREVREANERQERSYQSRMEKLEQRGAELERQGAEQHARNEELQLKLKKRKVNFPFLLNTVAGIVLGIVKIGAASHGIPIP